MKYVLLAFLTISAVALAKAEAKVEKVTKKKVAPATEVSQVLASYRNATAVQAKVKKTVAQEAMGTEMKSQGNFYFSKGKMRLEMLEPERTTLVYDGKTVWFEQRIDDDHVVVTKMRALELRRSDSILAALFDKKDVFKNFTLKKADVDESQKNFIFEANDKKKSDVQSLEIALKGKDLQRISYSDRLENRVTLEFSDLTKGAVGKDKFAYKPPKNAEITEP